MIALNDFGFVVRELLNEPVLIMARNGNLEFDPSIKQRAIHPCSGLEKSLLPFGTCRIAAAVEPFNGKVIGVETRHTMVRQVVYRAAPVTIALPFISAAEMEMSEVDLFREEKIGKSARSGTGGSAGFPGEVPGDKR